MRRAVSAKVPPVPMAPPEATSRDLEVTGALTS
jgi:hypothetical protein